MAEVQEEWREVAGFPDYVVSSLGRVVSHKRAMPREMSPSVGRLGHRAVCLFRDGVGHMFRVHALVAAAFIGPRPARMEVRHLDGDPTNNAVTNLAYGSSRDNSLDSVRHGSHVNARKTACPRGHPYDDVNTRVSGGKRFCRACGRASVSAAYYAKRARTNG